MRLAGLLERERRVNQRFDGTRFEERPDFFPQFRGDRGFLRNGACPQCRAGHRQTAQHDGTQIEIPDTRRLQKSDLNKTAFRRHQGQILFEICSPNHVEHDIDTMFASDLSDVFDEVMGFVIDCEIGSEGFAKGAFRA